MTPVENDASAGRLQARAAANLKGGLETGILSEQR
jgi:hypothetical protein